MIGRTIGNYEVTGHIGAGGMGEVYRARDTQLGRDVAMKVLPETFAADPERLMRFEREARLLASLNHGNIATIHGVESDGGHRILVMEYAEGEDLAARIARGPVPVDDAVAVARQIADALEAAHDQGVIHRDLKPANVVVTTHGVVKVLDFGLAKAIEGDASNSGLSQSPTLLGSSPTALGVILGTAAYMSPEQARGKRVDRRADVFAFGCVLYEMFTGKRVFDGDTVSDTLAAVLRAEPDWNALPADIPPRVRALLKRCLEKDPRMRLRDMGEARIVLDAVAGGDTGEAPAAAAPAAPSRPWLVWVLAGLLLACATGWFLTRSPTEAVDTRVVTAALPIPEETPMSLWGAHPGPPTLSPDGKYVALCVIAGSGPHLAVRELATDEIRSFAGTDGAGYPFWSPDSRQIGFFATGKLRRVNLTGGAPVTICDAEVGKGGTWLTDGTIIFAPSYSTAIHRVAATGGTSEAITQLDSTHDESSHRFPRVLPGEEHFVYVVRQFGGASAGGHTLRIASIDGKTVKDLFATESDAMYADGYLFFVREKALLAQPFDLGTLSLAGDPIIVANDVQVMSGAAHAVFDVSPAGVMIFHQGEDASNRLLYLVDGTTGHELRQIGEKQSYDVPVHLSPDGSQLLAGAHSVLGGTADLWILGVDRGTRTRLTFDPGHENNSHWSSDGTRVAFTSRTDGVFVPVIKPVAGSGEETPILTGGDDVFLAGWSPDQKYLLGHKLGGGLGGGQGRLVALPLQEGLPDPFANQQLPPSLGGVGGLYRISFSPDGAWLAYESSEGGQDEISAMPFGRPGRRWQITLNGGSSPRWTDGYIYFLRERRVWRIPVQANATGLVIGDEEKYYDSRWVLDFDVTRDRSRMVVVCNENSAGQTVLTLVLNWPQLLAEKH
jgi:Tol biopolymer transport system component